MSIFTPPFYLGSADGLVILLVVVATAVSTVIFRAKVWRVNPIVMVASLGWHSFYSVIYCVLGARSGGDIFLYYERARHAADWGDLYGLGTTFIVWFVHPFVDGIQIGILPISIIFGVLGFFGIWLIAAAIVENLDASRRERGLRFVYILVFLPSINHWTSALGKDSLIIFALSLIFFALSRPRRRWVLAAAGWILAFHIRPHIGIVLLMAAAVSLVFSVRSMNVWRRITAIATMLVAGLVAYPYVVSFLGLEGGGVSEYVSYMEQRGAANMTGGSSVNMSNYSIPGRVFAFLFRPLPFEAHNATSLIASLENVVLLILVVIAFLKYRLVHTIRGGSLLIVFLAYYSIGSAILLSGVTLNLGLAFRQKTMVIVAVIALVAVAASRGSKRVRHRASVTHAT